MARLDEAQGAQAVDAEAGARRWEQVQEIAWRVVPFLSVAALVAAWEIVARSGAVTPYLLPSVGTVLARIWTDAAAHSLLAPAQISS